MKLVPGSSLEFLRKKVKLLKYCAKQKEKLKQKTKRTVTLLMTKQVSKLVS